MQLAGCVCESPLGDFTCVPNLLQLDAGLARFQSLQQLIGRDHSSYGKLLANRRGQRRAEQEDGRIRSRLAVLASLDSDPAMANAKLSAQFAKMRQQRLGR